MLVSSSSDKPKALIRNIGFHPFFSCTLRFYPDPLYNLCLLYPVLYSDISSSSVISIICFCSFLVHPASAPYLQILFLYPALPPYSYMYQPLYPQCTLLPYPAPLPRSSNLRSFSETRSSGGGAASLQRRMSGAFSKPLEGFRGGNPLGMSYNSIDRCQDTSCRHAM